MVEQNPLDPKGLIREAFRIDGIDSADCRTIFLDWALSVDGGMDTQTRIEALIKQHSDEPADHPMQAVLREGLQSANPPARRGGARARR